ncbi:hypothetical protein CR513_47908, partial [Mucuna pruriens]
MKYLVADRVGTVRVDQGVAHRCYKASLKFDSRGEGLAIRRTSNRAQVHFLNLDLHQNLGGLEASVNGGLKGSLDQLEFDEEDEYRQGSGGESREVADSFPLGESRQDMLRVDPNFLCYSLSIAPRTHSVTQKKRRLGEEKGGDKQATSCPLHKGIPFSGKWRMCTDYTDMNKACPKDPYLLPSIDRLVDGASRYGLLSFMETYSRCHVSTFDGQGLQGSYRSRAGGACGH